MGFLDSLKMALHNLWHNKSRTLLTIIIVFVVSALIMAMCLLGTNFISNQEQINREIFSQTGTSYSLQPKQISSPNGGYMHSMISMDEVEKVAEISRKHTNVVDSFYINCDNIDLVSGERGASVTPAFADFTFPFGRAAGKIKEGRLWTATDKDKANVWVSEAMVERLSALGIACGVGDTFSLTIAETTRTDESNMGQSKPGGENIIPKRFTAEYTVVGTIVPNMDEGNYWSNIDAPQIYISLDFIKKEITKPYIKELSIKYNPVGGSYSYTAVQKNMEKYVKEVQLAVGKTVTQNGTYDRFSGSFLDVIKLTRMMGYMIMGVLAFLALLILLLSVGSVANTIIISVDKNKKFIGLMKAMGLNNRGVKGIVYKEAFITITLGVLLALILILALSPVISLALNAIMSGMFMMVTEEVTVKFVLHAYVPIITILAFVGLALLFSRGAVNRMGKADVISIISEVA